MEFISLAGEKGTLTLRVQGLLDLAWVPGSILGREDAADCLSALMRLSSGRPLPLLMEIADVAFTAEARRHMRILPVASAIAVVGATMVDQVVAASLFRGNVCPQAFFSTRAKAVEWLLGPGELLES